MKPEEMRDDIPMDVREALFRVLKGQSLTEYEQSRDRLRDAIRAKPRTVHLPPADLPAPLEEEPEGGKVWSVSGWYGITWHKATHPDAAEAVERGLAFATCEEAEAWLAHLQSWKRPGVDWTPHTPGDPMPCDGEERVDLANHLFSMLQPISRRPQKAKDTNWKVNTPVRFWRYAREGEA